MWKGVYTMTNVNADMRQEVREARAAGIRALNSLRRAEKHLDSARAWGFFDMLGGGFIPSLVKHSKLDDARGEIEQARCDLEAFRQELQDVDLPDATVDSLLTFADFFFDGFLADFLVQRRINEARSQLDRACRQVEDVLRQLPADNIG